jgi:hypothetical protein
MKKSHRLSGIILIALILTVATFAFAAANTLPATTSAGDGARAISGYDITNVKYNLDTTDPALINTVTFTITPAAATSVKIQLVSSGSWFDCTNTAGAVSCNVAGAVTATAANNLRVVASN